MSSQATLENEALATERELGLRDLCEGGLFSSSRFQPL